MVTSAILRRLNDAIASSRLVLGKHPKAATISRELLVLWPKIKRGVAGTFSPEEDPIGRPFYNCIPPTVVPEQLIDQVPKKAYPLRTVAGRAEMDQ